MCVPLRTGAECVLRQQAARGEIMANSNNPTKNRDENRPFGSEERFDDQIRRTPEGGHMSTDRLKGMATGAGQAAAATATNVGQKAQEMASTVAHRAGDLATAAGQQMEHATAAVGSGMKSL